MLQPFFPPAVDIRCLGLRISCHDAATGRLAVWDINPSCMQAPQTDGGQQGPHVDFDRYKLAPTPTALLVLPRSSLWGL
ncbi:hypothetical protein ACUXG4_000481 [Cupriavidus metallidurans]